MRSVGEAKRYITVYHIIDKMATGWGNFVKKTHHAVA